MSINWSQFTRDLNTNLLELFYADKLTFIYMLINRKFTHSNLHNYSDELKLSILKKKVSINKRKFE